MSIAQGVSIVVIVVIVIVIVVIIIVIVISIVTVIIIVVVIIVVIYSLQLKKHMEKHKGNVTEYVREELKNCKLPEYFAPPFEAGLV